MDPDPDLPDLGGKEVSFDATYAMFTGHRAAQGASGVEHHPECALGGLRQPPRGVLREWAGKNHRAVVLLVQPQTGDLVKGRRGYP